MSDVSVAALGDLVAITRGKTYKSALIGRPGPVLLGLATIARNGGFRTDSLRTYGGDSPENLLVRPGEIFASLKDVTQSADLLGSVARVPVDGTTGRLTQDTVRLDVISDAVDPDYLYLSLLTPAYRTYCRSHATGTTNLGLPRDDFLSYEIRLPPLEEQRRIAAVFGALDDLIDANEKLVRHIDETQRAIFLASWDRATRTRLDSIGTVIMGQSPPGAALNEDGDGTIFYQGVRDFGWRYPTPRIYATEAKRLADPGDVLVAVRAPVGELNVATSVTALGRGVGAVRVPGRQSTLFQALRANEAVWDAHRATGTVFASINKAGMAALEIPWVDDDELEHLLASLDEAVLELHHEVGELRRARDDLLPILMAGKVRVNDAKELV